MTGSRSRSNSQTAGRIAHRRGLLLGLALFLGVCTPAYLADAEPDVPPLNRDAVWRAIFKRPEGIPGGEASEAQVALGRRLFNDTRLSGTGTLACASCHQEARAFTDGRALGQGRDGATLARNVPMLFNLAWATAFFWDGRAKSLEEQAKGPMLAPDEMGGHLPQILANLSEDPDTAAQFSSAFPGPDPVREETVLKALAAYERTLISPRTRFDQWVDGDDDALSAEERQGFAIFVGKGACVSCHGGWRFTDDTRHDIGLKSTTGEIPNFKTPSLRETLKTAPYMHDGSKPTLRAIIDHYTGELTVRPTLANNIVRNLSLTDSEKESLVAFLKTLSSDAKK